MNQSEELKTFAQKLKEGYKLMDEGQYEEAKVEFAPFIEMMRRADTLQFRLFYSYSIAQLRTGDIDGFFKTYHEIQGIKLKSKEEERQKKQVDELFFNMMEELEREEYEQ